MRRVHPVSSQSARKNGRRGWWRWRGEATVAMEDRDGCERVRASEKESVVGGQKSLREAELTVGMSESLDSDGCKGGCRGEG